MNSHQIEKLLIFLKTGTFILNVPVFCSMIEGMKVIILAGGKATRLPNSAADIPKSLVEVAGKPVLQHQIDLLERVGFSDITFALGMKADRIVDYVKDKYEYVVEQSQLGTGGAIKFASRGLREPFFVLNGDVLSNIHFGDFWDTYKRSGAENMIVAWRCLDVRDFGHLEMDWSFDSSGKSARITDFLEKPVTKSAGFINAGAYLLSPDIFKNDPQESFSIEKDIFPRLVGEKKLHAYMHEGWWMEMGTEERLEDVRKEFDKKFR